MAADAASIFNSRSVSSSVVSRPEVVGCLLNADEFHKFGYPIRCNVPGFRFAENKPRRRDAFNAL